MPIRMQHGVKRVVVCFSFSEERGIIVLSVHNCVTDYIVLLQ